MQGILTAALPPAVQVVQATPLLARARLREHDEMRGRHATHSFSRELEQRECGPV